ncbi:hypothetical protein AYB34_10800 [Leptospira sp. ZV016]|nr:hypothetical protein AYB32_14695 [Leptospira kirschneri]KXZ33722.1 hypothetical protein AYB34_10800 [Leptospira sp. ZV016]
MNMLQNICKCLFQWIPKPNFQLHQESSLLSKQSKTLFKSDKANLNHRIERLLLNSKNFYSATVSILVVSNDVIFNRIYHKIIFFRFTLKEPSVNFLFI